MYKNLTIASFLGFIAITLGAFGAHILKSKLSISAFQSFETAVRYQIYHVLLILFVNSFQELTKKVKNRISTLLFIGILFFSGSIYLICLASIPAKFIWFITPLGGLFLIAAWLLLFFSFFKNIVNKNI